jgi:hypothetical protein
MSQPQISVTTPAPGATGRKRYPTVELRLDGPRCELRYAWNAGRLELAELTIKQGFDDPAGQKVEPISTRMLAQLDRTARGALALTSSEYDTMDPRRPRIRREMSPEFLRDVLRRHLEHGGSTEALAREEGVGASTVRHWLRKAREAGIEA